MPPVEIERGCEADVVRAPWHLVTLRIQSLLWHVSSVLQPPGLAGSEVASPISYPYRSILGLTGVTGLLESRLVTCLISKAKPRHVV